MNDVVIDHVRDYGLCSVDEAAKKLGVTRQSVYNMMVANAIEWVSSGDAGRMVVVESLEEAREARKNILVNKLLNMGYAEVIVR